jgi:environmental stress-induced protein Ves
VSVAEVSQAGPFSRFEEIDRTLLVLAGRLVLAVEGREAVTLAAGGAAFHFAGEAACLGTPVGGAARVLNVMTRRGRFAAGARRVGTGPAGDAAGPCLFVATAPATLRLGGGLWRLAADDAAMWNEGRPWLDGAGITIAIRRVS